jgi:hypothetical protein
MEVSNKKSTNIQNFFDVQLIDDDAFSIDCKNNELVIEGCIILKK